jgi:hypothetical protein
VTGAQVANQYLALSQNAIVVSGKDARQSMRTTCMSFQGLVCGYSGRRAGTVRMRSERLKRLPPRPEGPQHRPTSRPNVGPPVAVQVRLDMARPCDLRPPECPQVQGLVVDAPHVSIRAEDQLLAELAHPCVEARELVLGEQPDARLWKGEGFSPPLARRFAADPCDVAEARMLRVEDQLRGREELFTRPEMLSPPWSAVRGQGLTDAQPREGEPDGGQEWSGACWGRRRRASPHIPRKKKEKKNKRRNGTGSSGMLMNLGQNAEVPRRKCGGWWGGEDRARAPAPSLVRGPS